LANLEHAQRQANLADFRVDVRRKQLKNLEKKLQVETESECLEQEEERFQ